MKTHLDYGQVEVIYCTHLVPVYLFNDREIHVVMDFHRSREYQKHSITLGIRRQQ